MSERIVLGEACRKGTPESCGTPLVSTRFYKQVPLRESRGGGARMPAPNNRTTPRDITWVPWCGPGLVRVRAAFPPNRDGYAARSRRSI